ncbi:Protein kinase domain/Protein tyrosine kinase, putative [Angomonas deanei]|uniref:Protein kinase domain/Protein tyrosine kinase, putative n=1 Tax=Angomonas deanei TaxID=59799 RepID=A0A7G2CLE5_9TRYP|nr:Protein kinase domain/Protein tyrosine kinase, putative [Angomonas deanei]
MDRETNRIIAVKEIALNIVGGSKESLDTVRRELAVLKQLDHPNITKYLGEEVEEDFLRIYMEYIPCGSISALLRTFGPLQENQVTIYIRQVLQGLEYLHGKCIIHRDLKGDNLLVNADGSLKLADFGTAKDMREAGTLRKVNGTANFMSPEAVEGKTVDEKTDVWSVGCCAVEMLTGTPPLAGVPSQYAIMMQIAEAKEDTLSMYLPSHAEFSKHAKDFVRQCLQRDPAKRPSAAELRAHPWLTKDPAWGSSRVASSSGPTPCNTTDTSATPTGENMVQKEHRSKSKRRSDSKKGSTSKKRSIDTAEDDKSSKKKRSGKKSKSRHSKSKSPTPSALNTLDLTLLPGDNSGDDDLPGRAITPA